MALPFFNNGSRKKLDQILAVDLGSRFTKVVHVQRRGDGLALCGYAILDAPICEKALTAQLLKDHLVLVGQSFPTKPKHLALTVSVSDAIVRHVDMPPMPDEDIRMVLKHNSRSYFQQELSGYLFDFFKTPDTAGSNSEAGKTTGAAKHKMLIAGAKNEIINEYVTGAREAGFVPDHIVPCVLGPVNAFENAHPELFASEVVALVDIGFKSSSISIVKEGELMLNRVVTIGGDRLTTGLS
ncbi:MAG: pilus assembly protein PilM, partial [Akkermansiaceae bacterium]|nr:pilus assembly protein PilM [Verrucomicrobiales bacterium]